MAEKKKTDINLPFFKIQEDDKGSYVEVGPVKVTGTKEEEKVKVGPILISDEGVRMERSLNSKLEGMALAAFIILIGSVLLSKSVYGLDLPGVVYMGVGVIWLSLNYARSRLNIKTSTFTIVLGIIALIYGAAEFFIGEIEILAVAAIAIGLYFIVKYTRS